MNKSEKNYFWRSWRSYYILYSKMLSYEILIFMRDEVSKDDNWRVQEVLAKAFDEFCKQSGYEKSLPVIDDWLQNTNPNVRRAVTEGLRLWTSRPYSQG